MDSGQLTVDSGQLPWPQADKIALVINAFFALAPSYHRLKMLRSPPAEPSFPIADAESKVPWRVGVTD